jgi:DNA (cytosine-5)-methyltransferase 1
LADAESEGRPHGRSGTVQPLAAESGGSSVSPDRPGPTNGLWRDADWLYCRDDKWRPVEPGTFPLADAAASRVGRLRAYGNALDAETATQFVAAVMDCAP